MSEAQRHSACPAELAVDLQAWIEAYGERLLRAAYLLCGDETEAQDLVQDTFVQALQAAPRFRGNSAVYTWLYGILRNLCLRHLRKQKRFLFEEDLLLQETSPPGTAQESDQAFCASKLAQALQQLSPEHREVLVLRYYDNLKIQEIALQTGVSTGTVKSRLHYAVRCLEPLLPREMNPFAVSGTERTERS